MDVGELLDDLFGRIPEEVHTAVDGLDADALTRTVVPGTTSIGWWVWHLTRVRDSHVAEAWDVEQLWSAGAWAGRFGLDPDPHNTGYGPTLYHMEVVRTARDRAVRHYTH